jgi:hypothetical protein
MDADGVHDFARARNAILAGAISSDPSTEGAEKAGVCEVAYIHVGGVGSRGEVSTEDLAHDETPPTTTNGLLA